MFEEDIIKVSEYFNHSHSVKFYILPNHKNNREIYLRARDKNALNFLKPKFNSFKKKTALIMLRIGLLQPFLKKIKLPYDVGSVILVGGQIKTFNLDNRLVYSFPHSQWDNDKFIADKKNQKQLGKEGIAPRIVRIREDEFYSCEELVTPYTGDIEDVFDTLLYYYNSNNLINIPSKDLPIYDFADGLNINPIIDRALNDIRKVNNYLFTKIHGEFSKEQVVVDDDNNIMFVDWDLRDGLITEDLVNMFRFDANYFTTDEFKKIIIKYPEHVQDNLKEYLLLTELLRVRQHSEHYDLSMKRIENIIQFVW